MWCDKHVDNLHCPVSYFSSSSRWQRADNHSVSISAMLVPSLLHFPHVIQGTNTVWILGEFRRNGDCIHCVVVWYQGQWQRTMCVCVTISSTCKNVKYMYAERRSHNLQCALECIVLDYRLYCHTFCDKKRSLNRHLAAQCHVLLQSAKMSSQHGCHTDI